jgi:hypothetical protein
MERQQTARNGLERFEEPERTDQADAITSDVDACA